MDKKVWVILASAILCQWTHALPVPEEDDSLISNRTETSMTAGEEKKDGKAISPVSRLPTSPVDLLRPDKISFYTFDSNGQVVLKRMTEKEIQSLIAAGGGQLPVAISEPQKISASTGTKISDVVQNVQKVLEGELNKPPQEMTAMPTIPGHANSEWSSILPSILSGDSDSEPIQFVEDSEIIEESEKPMIQVPVITIEEPVHQYETPEEKPVFQILNTIPADKFNQDNQNLPSEVIIPVEAKQPPEESKNDTWSVVSETHSTSVKVSGQDEVKIHQKIPPEVPFKEQVKPTEASTSLAPVLTTLKITTKAPAFDSSTTEKSHLANEVSSTAATPASEETPQKSQTEALPTELTDSITSMINQVSDVHPSMMMDEKSKVPEAGSGDGLIDAAEALESTTSVIKSVTTTEKAEIDDFESKTEPVSKAETSTSKIEVTTLKIEPSTPKIEALTKIEFSTSKIEVLDSKIEPLEPKTESSTSKIEVLDTKIEPTTKTESSTSKIEALEPKEATTSEELTTITSKIELSTEKTTPKPEPEKTSITSELNAVLSTETYQDITEKPILRINITETKQDLKIPSNVSVTESTMVRIKLTDPLNKVHEILESSAVQPTTPEVEPLALPTTEVSANGLASGLIAGFTEPQGTEMSMEMIQFDQLPMISVLKLENSSQASTETVPKVELVTEADPESKTPEPQVRKDQKKETSLEKTVTSATEKEPERWTLIPQTSPKPKEPVRTEAPPTGKRPSVMQPSIPGKPEPPRSPDPPSQHIPLDHSKTTPGLDSSVLNLEPDVLYFSNLCNDLAFNLWSAVNQGLSKSRSLAVSPFGMTSLLAMIFLGARGPTSNQMNDVLKLDDITTFNPHLIFQNVTDSVASRRNQGIANAVFVRELFADKLKVNKLMTFYKEQAQKFYDGIVAEVNFSFVSNAVKRRTNLLIRKQTGGRIREFVKDNNLVPLRSPLAAVSANVFQTDCSSGNATSEGRDGELYFAVAPTVKLRKLVPVPATLWKAGVLAGYETSLDATAIALGGLDKMVSVIFVIPGSQGGLATGDNLEKLEGRIVNGALHDGAWNKLLKVIIPRPGLELQVPKFSHKSIINSTAALKNMGLEDIFEKHANLRGINDIGKDLHLADVFQMNLFSTCGDENFLAGKHHEEVYPASSQRNARSEEITEENSTIGQEKTDTYYESEAERIARFTRQVDNEKPRLKLDRPFLYFVRHNPTGLILYMGRFNPRLIS